MHRKVSEIGAGDVVDLQGDRYADPEATNPVYMVENAEVVAADPEVDGWVRLHFEGLPSVSFPADHALPCAPPGPPGTSPGPR